MAERLARGTRRVAPRRAAAITIDAGLCKQCGVCVALCPRDVFDVDADGTPVASRADDCTACRFCEQHCPDFAIEVVEEARS
jgi:2-oxoglutarate ferredoxin oxidoreductase subunit delta